MLVTVIDPNTTTDPLASRPVKNVFVADGQIAVDAELGYDQQR